MISMVFRNSTVATYILILSVLGFYHLVFEIWNEGQSIGKKALGLRVVNLRGTTPTLQSYILRWLFRIIDIGGSLGTLALGFVSTTANNQRIGDIIAQTLVINLKSDKHIGLADLSNFYSREKSITFPKLERYSDSDMLLVKESLNRYSKYPSTENELIIAELADRIQHDLELNRQLHPDNVVFLESILEDYILLTR